MTTIRAMLFGDLVSGPAGSAARGVEEAAERLAGVGAVAPHREATPVFIARTVLTKVADLLNIEISDVLVGAWRTRSALLQAAHETWAKPGTYQQVPIKTYSFAWDHEIDVDVSLNSSKIAAITFVVSVDADITALAVTVHSGRITTVSAGNGSVTIALRVKGETPGTIPLAQREQGIDLTYELKVTGQGIPLIEEARSAPNAR